MKLKKLKLTKTVLRDLSSKDKINLQGGYDSDKLCTRDPCPGNPTFDCTLVGPNCIVETDLC